MLSSEKFYVRSNAMKANAGISILDYVKTLVRHTELSKAEDKIADAKKMIEEAHADVDPMTCADAIVIEVLKNDADDFIKGRKEVIALRSECAECISLENVTSLCPTDRVHITLMAHAIYSGVLLDAELFDPEKGGVDFTKAISLFFKNGTVSSNLKDNMKTIFNKILGTEGDYFYAVKPKKSDFDKSDIMHFLSRFSGKARRSSTKKDGVINWGDYKYRTKTDKNTQRRAFTEFCAVVLDNASKHSVVKPDAEDQEQA